MKRTLGIATLFIVLIVSGAYAQFLVRASPHSVTVTGATATFSVKVLVEVGFKSTVYLSASAPTLPQAQISIAPNMVNAPYTDSATATLTLTGPKNGGTHSIYIKAANGPAVAYDTVSVTIPNRTAWKVFTPEESGYNDNYYRFSPAQFVLDKRHGIGWLAGMDSLRSYDGTVWKAYAWPPNKYQHQYEDPTGITIDSSGALWVVCEKRLFKRVDTTWTVIDTADAATGLTNEMIGSLVYNYQSTYSRIHTTPDGTLWLLSGDPSRGIWILRKDSVWHAYNSANSQAPYYGGTNMITDSKGNLWIIPDLTNGIVKFDGTYWTQYNIDIDSRYISFAADRNGWIWMRGSRPDDRVIQFNGDSATYYYGKNIISTPPNTIDTTYIGQNVRSLDIDRDGDIWVAMEESTRDGFEGGLARYHDSTWYHYTISNSGLPSNHGMYVSVDDAKKVWILTTEEGGGGIGTLTILDGTAPPNSAFNGSPSSVAPIAGNKSYIGAGHLTISPNPASSHTTIQLRLSTSDRVRLRLVNSLGQQVALLLDEVRNPGKYSVPIPTEGLAAGTYFVQFIGNGVSEAYPLVVAE